METEVLANRKVADGVSFLDFKKNCSTQEFPDKFSRYLMSFGEVYFWPKGNFHVVTDVELSKHVLKSSDFSADRSQFFISRMPNMDLRLIKDFFAVVQKMMVMSDGADHAKRRKAATGGFDDDVLQRFEDQVHASVENLLCQAFSKSQTEFVEEVAKLLPSTVLADLFSIPQTDRSDFFRWSNTMTAFFGGATTYENHDGVRVNEAASSLRNYFLNLIQTRRENPSDDYVSSLIRSQQTYGLTDDEVVSQAIMMLVAGQVTTTDQICNILYLIAERKDLQEALRNNPELIPAALEELKRYDPAVTFLFRVAKTKTFLGSQPIEPGETVFISNHGVNRDPKIKNAFEIDIQRAPAAQHFAYGHGAHYCLGAKLGRMQMNFLFQNLLTKYPAICLDADRPAIRDHYSLSFSGFSEIHLKTEILSV